MGNETETKTKAEEELKKAIDAMECWVVGSGRSPDTCQKVFTVKDNAVKYAQSVLLATLEDSPDDTTPYGQVSLSYHRGRSALGWLMYAERKVE
jgi:hypothetical protein